MIKQKFIPGEEWLYLKIFLPATKADEFVASLHIRIAKKYPECISSLIHMHCNRLFRMNQRICEAVVYYFLTKYYGSRIARGRMG